MEYGGQAVRGESSEANPEDRVRELESENARLRLLVGELLVANQRLREEGRRSHGAPLAAA